MKVTSVASLALVCLLVAPALALIVEVPPNNQECVFENLAKNERMIASFEVLAGGLLDINIKVRLLRWCILSCIPWIRANFPWMKP